MIRLFAILALLLTSPNIYSQTNIPLLDRHLSLRFTNIPLHKVLFSISEEADFNLSFKADIVPADSLITYTCKEKRLEEILPTILPNRIDIKTIGNNVILLNKPTSEKRKESIVLRGNVVDQMTQNPLQNVTVLDVYGSQSALTNASGEFELQLTHKQADLVISIIKSGYKDSTLSLLPKNQSLAIKLLNNESMAIPTQLKKVENIPIKAVESYPLGRMMIPQVMQTHSENIQGYIKRRFQISLIPGLSSNFKIAGTVKNETSINLIGGYNYGVEAFEMAGVFNINRTDVSGLQIAGMANLVGREVNGVQLSGVFNGTKGKQIGTQIAGFGNFNSDDFFGTQLAGVWNQTNNLDGIQIGGVVNIADSLTGLQLTSVYNKSEFLDGVQISAGFNSAETMDGVQIGIVNRAKQQNGFQFGFININETSDGVSIGLFNFVKDKNFPRIGFAYK